MFTVQSGKIDGINKHIAVVTLSIGMPAKDRKNHNILILDCSGSMAGSIDDVRRDSQKYIEELGDKDFVSVIIFSGHGRAKLIVGPTQCNTLGRQFLKTAIQNEVKILDTTVFSEPLEMAVATVKRLTGPDTIHNAVLFTDGCPVPTKWSISSEETKTCEAARTLFNMGCIVSAVGYGVYYNERFINNLIRAAGNEGIFRHISEIEDFGCVIGNIREVFEKTVISNITLTFRPDAGVAGRVFKTTPQLFVSSETGKISMKGLYEGKATIFIELSGPCSSIKIAGNVSGENVNETIKPGKLSDENTADFVRILGAAAFLNGDYATAAQMLSLVNDEGLAEQVANAFTSREQREAADTFRRYFTDRKFIGAGLKPTGPSHCVLNVIRTLIEDPDNIVYLPKSAYKRSGLLTVDPNIIESPLGRTLQVVGYRSDNSRFNFSVLCLKDVKVKQETGGRPVDMKIWRAYNIILDANLHMSEIEASLSPKSFDVLKEAGVIDSETYALGKAYTINLRGLKMISPAWANPINLGLVNLLGEEADLEVQQTALNARRKELMPVVSVTAELVPGGVYTPKSIVAEGVPVEYYTAPCCEYRLMKYKGVSYECGTMSLEEAENKVKEVRQRLIVVRFLIRAITFAMEMVKSNSIKWDTGKISQRGKYPKLEQSALFMGAELKRVTWEEQFVCS